jgi:hypothetical protein
LHCGSADQTPEIPSNSVDLVVTSPPFLDVVQYHADNWMRNWFAEVDESKVAQNFIYERSLEGWSDRMGRVFQEIYRVLKPGAWFAIEVGEVKKGTLQMEDLLLPLGADHGFSVHGVLIHTQVFTKTAHIWGVRNNVTGTNSQRIVLFQRQ